MSIEIKFTHANGGDQLAFDGITAQVGDSSVQDRDPDTISYDEAILVDHYIENSHLRERLPEGADINDLNIHIGQADVDYRNLRSIIRRGHPHQLRLEGVFGTPEQATLGLRAGYTHRVLTGSDSLAYVGGFGQLELPIGGGEEVSGQALSPSDRASGLRSRTNSLSRRMAAGAIVGFRHYLIGSISLGGEAAVAVYSASGESRANRAGDLGTRYCSGSNGIFGGDRGTGGCAARPLNPSASGNNNDTTPLSQWGIDITLAGLAGMDLGSGTLLLRPALRILRSFSEEPTHLGFEGSVLYEIPLGSDRPSHTGRVEIFPSTPIPTPTPASVPAPTPAEPSESHTPSPGAQETTSSPAPAAASAPSPEPVPAAPTPPTPPPTSTPAPTPVPEVAPAPTPGIQQNPSVPQRRPRTGTRSPDATPISSPTATPVPEAAPAPAQLAQQNPGTPPVIVPALRPANEQPNISRGNYITGSSGTYHSGRYNGIVTGFMTFRRDRLEAAIRVLTGQDTVHFGRLPLVLSASYSGGALTYRLSTPSYVSRNFAYRIRATVLTDNNPRPTFRVTWHNADPQPDPSTYTIFDSNDGYWQFAPDPTFEDVYRVTWHSTTVVNHDSLPVGAWVVSDSTVESDSNAGTRNNFNGMATILRGL